MASRCLGRCRCRQWASRHVTAGTGGESRAPRALDRRSLRGPGASRHTPACASRLAPPHRHGDAVRRHPSGPAIAGPRPRRRGRVALTIATATGPAQASTGPAGNRAPGLGFNWVARIEDATRVTWRVCRGRGPAGSRAAARPRAWQRGRSAWSARWAAAAERAAPEPRPQSGFTGRATRPLWSAGTAAALRSPGLKDGARRSAGPVRAGSKQLARKDIRCMPVGLQ